MITSLIPYEYNVLSKDGSDGIINMIFNTIGTTNKFFVEFGIDGLDATPFLFYEHRWYGIWMDSDYDDPKVKKETITAENINEIFAKHQVPKEFDLLCIDIDSNDYWVWKALDYSPRVVVIEYNAHIPPNESKVVSYDVNFVHKKDDYFGASLLAMYNLGKEKGYTLIGCDSVGANAFFVKSELAEGKFKGGTVEELYMSPRYGTPRDTYPFHGCVKSDRTMIDI